ncbi:unnamed protein product [Phytophthora lilii]|uniref:Unnamed protein product n=1 Tax=Phytophthora lilii TaxID=2077276 RepID=A0A9W6U843_9STRA|nr:unnamed protein product [Phytophthora lilii]
MKAYSTTSSLESASAPAPKKDVPIKPIGTSGWKSKRVPAPAPKPRTLLASTEKRMKLNDEPPKPPVVSRHYELRDRRPKLFEHSPTSTEPFTLRSSRSTRLGKRKMNSEGSAEKPIALDSDSESEPEVQAATTSLDETATVAEGSNGSEKDEAKEDREENPPAIDLEEISLHAAIRMHNCEVMIGLFQCVVDLFFQGDRVCMRSIRAKHYKVPKEAEASSEINVEEPDRMEQLLGEASFIALKLPLSEEEDRVAMRSFYDPAGSGMK